ncbi:MAG: beta-lactamase family protein, partial [Rhodobacteraceae bacterium]|nr:beta-lactamase family protein [Paracoccaceae bacterium]
MAKLTQALIAEQTRRMCRARHVHGAIMAVDHPASGFRHAAAAGDLAADMQFCAASTTKLIVTIITMQLVAEGRLALDGRMADHLPPEVITGLHRKGGQDHTDRITIRHLISNQTGLRDYFSLPGPDGRKPMDTLMAGEDAPWPVERVLEVVRKSEAEFLPGEAGKVAYSDTNYQLMGMIFERVTGQTLPVLFAERVFAPLGLDKTYIFADPADDRPVWFYAGARRVHLPCYLASVQAEGGMVTTADELARIGGAVFEGRLFDIEALLAQQDWRMIWWPGQFYFGLGMEKLWTPWFLSPLRPIRDVMGFWGQTGAF